MSVSNSGSEARRDLLLSQFDAEANFPLQFEELSAGSSRKVSWSCELGHTWQATVYDRNRRGQNCPYCTGQRPVKGISDLPTRQPRLMSEWDPANKKDPSCYMEFSNAKVGWICRNEHRWQARISARSLGAGCPYCSGNKLLFARSLTGAQPSLSEQLLDPELGKEIFANGGKKVKWHCSSGHEWEATPRDRSRGSGCPYCSGSVLWPSDQKGLAFSDPLLAAEIHPTLNKDVDLQQISRGSMCKLWWLCANAHQWQARVDSRALAGAGCPECNIAYQKSKPEREIADHLQSLGLKVEVGDRTLLNGKELDIYVPAKKIAIEFNGVYWHSEKFGKNKSYHYEKYNTAKMKGVQLLQIWEDDWRRDAQMVLGTLERKLGVAKAARVGARKTEVVNVSFFEAKAFLDKWHLQGHAAGRYYLGLKSGEELVAVLVLKQQGFKEFLITRYATSCIVQGGFGKLLKHVESNFDVERLITFSDNMISNGALYESNGFTAEKKLPPDYSYVSKGRRQHKFGYRLKRFKADPTLLYEEGLSERELAMLNQLPRIWDAGKILWAKKLGSFPHV